ncbi:helix-turn-helix domain-containing protein [Nocardia sp. BMG51109]|uniref:helix-turn-helix domain-containing protein n=1 Tax=Nocardia sp. BMG51109 TaxID=1056816 RepID=UPI0018DCF209|nr:helix-turn-helix transcriptional regulator [Nocardia sp. BMG51109]
MSEQPEPSADTPRFTRPSASRRTGAEALAAIRAEKAARETLSAEDVFAANLKTLRGDKNISQEALAEQMSQRGFKWHQATVYKIENGSRQVQLGEAKAVAGILGVPLDRLIDDTNAIQALSRIRALTHALVETDAELFNLSIHYEDQRKTLERIFNDLPDDVRGLLGEQDTAEIEERIRTSPTKIVNEPPPF